MVRLSKIVPEHFDLRDEASMCSFALILPYQIGIIIMINEGCCSISFSWLNMYNLAYTNFKKRPDLKKLFEEDDRESWDKTLFRI